jgi:hypothetical protein
LVASTDELASVAVGESGAVWGVGAAPPPADDPLVAEPLPVAENCSTDPCRRAKEGADDVTPESAVAP